MSSQQEDDKADSPDQGTKRKSPEDLAKSDENENDENGIFLKRIKQEPLQASIKLEPKPDTGTAESDADAPSSSRAVVKTEAKPKGPVRVKTEPVQGHGNAPTSSVAPSDPAPPASAYASAQSSDVSSSSIRPSCRYGIRCYRFDMLKLLFSLVFSKDSISRRNPAHLLAEAHPGAPDYRRPIFPAPPLGTPVCSYGNACYRRNPLHFQQYSHPSDFNSAQNISNRLRRRRAQRQRQNPSSWADDEEDEEDEEDPFGGDNDEDMDYRPGADIDEDEDEEDELEFESERLNADDYD
ncbi:hypothetical protein KR018_004381 [Drosophila ironensis]|nr:hypothetical protein KR018_004381 [Drosophila ironensis]